MEKKMYMLYIVLIGKKSSESFWKFTLVDVYELIWIPRKTNKDILHIYFFASWSILMK